MTVFYEVRTILYFNEQDEAMDFIHDCQLAKLKSVIINEGQPNQEYGTIKLYRNHHQEDPNKPCNLVAGF